MSNIFDLPYLGFGLGLRPDHYNDILTNKPDIDWFEIITENYMDTDGKPRYMLDQVREHYPIVMHGVSLSIGTVDPLNSEYLTALKKLIDDVNPVWISDHLCWTGVAHKQTHDLLPVPYTEEALKHIIQRLRDVQDFLERPILMENPSTYLEFQYADMTEWDFLKHMATESGCGLLLDANNVYVSCYNHKWDAKTYLDSLPMEHVVQIHLAGHQNNGTHIIDTHDDHVTDEVWKLYQYIINTAGPTNTMVEWDDKIPSFNVVQAELDKARAYAARNTRPNDLIQFPQNSAAKQNRNAPAYTPQLHQMQDAILKGSTKGAAAQKWIMPKPELSEEDQLNIYINGYRYRLFDIVFADYPALQHYLGEEEFSDLIDAYIEATPSRHPNVAHYIESFPAFVKDNADIFAYELAVLETDIERISDKKETPALTPEHLQNTPPDTVMAQPLPLRTALSLQRFSFPVNAYYTAVLEDENPSPPEKEQTYLAVYRHDHDMWRLSLEENEYNILCALQGGASINLALQKVLDGQDDDETLNAISQWFARWMHNHLLAAA